MALVAMLAAGCLAAETTGGMEVADDPERLIAVQVADSLNVEQVIMEVTVGPERVECVGLIPMLCLVVDGELFYDSIEGFEYAEGFSYRIRMARYDAWQGMEEIPMDTTRYGYRLVEIVSRTPVE